jgi:phage-related protein
VGTFGGGVYEVRTALDGNIYRVLFCLEDSTMVLLHAFMKKTETQLETTLLSLGIGSGKWRERDEQAHRFDP